MTPTTRSTSYLAGAITALITAAVALAGIYGLVTAEQATGWVALLNAVVSVVLLLVARHYVPDTPDSPAPPVTRLDSGYADADGVTH